VGSGTGVKRRALTTAPRAHPPVDLVLYVSAASTYTATAIRNCETLLKRFDAGCVHFEVCDVSAHPDRADQDAVCYTPLLVKRSPLPRTYLVGDLSNATLLLDLLSACGLEPAS
jgi:hypothetical protein